MNKEEKYQLLVEQVKALIEGEVDSIAIMANICAAIHETMGFFWTGFYRVMPIRKPNHSGEHSLELAPADPTSEELCLGPFQGPVACMHIPFGKGVCGSAWQQRQTIVVPDVELFPGHIACSSLSRSEIVVPLFSADRSRVVAVLDIDSRELATFDDIDCQYLERICQMIPV